MLLFGPSWTAIDGVKHQPSCPVLVPIADPQTGTSPALSFLEVVCANPRVISGVVQASVSLENAGNSGKSIASTLSAKLGVYIATAGKTTSEPSWRRSISIATSASRQAHGCEGGTGRIYDSLRDGVGIVGNAAFVPVAGKAATGSGGSKLSTWVAITSSVTSRRRLAVRLNQEPLPDRLLRSVDEHEHHVRTRPRAHLSPPVVHPRQTTDLEREAGANGVGSGVTQRRRSAHSRRHRVSV